MKKIQEEYYNNLFKQFKSAVEIEENIDSSLVIEMFSKWLDQNKINGKIYTMILEQIGIPYKAPNVLEIGKGDKDSVVLGNEKTTLVTPFVSNLQSPKNRIINAEFCILNKSLVLIEDRGNDVFYTPITSNSGIKRIMTQNPYSYRSIVNWKDIQEIGITVGVYGNLYDRDMNKKINRLKKLKSFLDENSEFIEKYIELYDGYYYLISTDNKIKKMER